MVSWSFLFDPVLKVFSLSPEQPLQNAKRNAFWLSAGNGENQQTTESRKISEKKTCGVRVVVSTKWKLKDRSKPARKKKKTDQKSDETEVEFSASPGDLDLLAGFAEKNRIYPII